MFNISVSSSRASFVLRSASGFWYSAVAASIDGLQVVVARDSDGCLYVYGPDPFAMKRAWHTGRLLMRLQRTA